MPESYYAQSVENAYQDGRCAGLVAWSHTGDGRAEPFGRRHTTIEEAVRFASEAKWPVVNLDPARKRGDRAFWIGYLRAFRNGLAA